jgi:hypothetical protein
MVGKLVQSIASLAEWHESKVFIELQVATDGGPFQLTPLAAAVVVA